MTAVPCSVVNVAKGLLRQRPKTRFRFCSVSVRHNGVPDGGVDLEMIASSLKFLYPQTHAKQSSRLDFRTNTAPAVTFEISAATRLACNLNASRWLTATSMRFMPQLRGNGPRVRVALTRPCAMKLAEKVSIWTAFRFWPTPYPCDRTGRSKDALWLNTLPEKELVTQVDLLRRPAALRSGKHRRPTMA